MGRRKNTVHNIPVVAPRLGSSSAPDSLVKAVATIAKKENRVFHELQPYTSAELQSMQAASYIVWRHHVPYGSEEYFNPVLLEDRPDMPPEDQTVDKDAPMEPNQVPATPVQESQDVMMAEAASPTRMYPQNPPGVARRDLSIGQPPNYTPYGQPMNLHQGNSIGEPLGHNHAYPHHMQPHSQHTMQRVVPDLGAGGLPTSQYPAAMIDGMRYTHPPPPPPPPQQHPQLGGLSYNSMIANPMVAQNPPTGINPVGMGMQYGGPPQGLYGSTAQGEHVVSAPQYGRPPPGGPMTGAYGGIY
ncbi:hypothetical protein FRC17_010714 [Serendipita sp. 399]|nr:hypothetical protein FRC17_010714 [Serendipita sp. 399]